MLRSKMFALAVLSCLTTWAAYIILRKIGIMHVLHCNQPWDRSLLRTHLPYTNASSHSLPFCSETSCRTLALCSYLRSNHTRHTFAISPQVFPASLMTFNLCSSAGLHGVLVRLFLRMGTGADSSPTSSTPSSILPDSPGPMGNDMVCMPGDGAAPGALRFLEGGELT